MPEADASWRCYTWHVTTRLFTRARWSAALAATLGVVAMLLYPGGTALDRTSHHYSLTQNFLSDLGMMAAWDGAPNRVGAPLFVASLVALVVGLGGALVGFVQLYSTSRRSSVLARAALAVGLLVSAAFVGVALTPEDRMMGLHVKFTLFAFRAFPGVTLLLALASRVSGVAPPRVTLAWSILTAVLLAYVALLGWGPPLDTPSGLATYVIAQKVVSIAAIGIVVYQSVEAQRSLAAGVR